MLTDLPDGWATNPSHPHAAWYAEYGHPSPVRLDRGQYLHLNDLDVEHLIARDYPFDPMFSPGTAEDRMAAIRAQYDNDTPHDYGVCDAPDQVLARWPELESDTRPFVISFRAVRKAEQPAEGGWRWHKWGTYIGTGNPSHEYLYDEPDFDVVYVFSISQLHPPVDGAQSATELNSRAAQATVKVPTP